jgi:hypothetical protein
MLERASSDWIAAGSTLNSYTRVTVIPSVTDVACDSFTDPCSDTPTDSLELWVVPCLARDSPVVKVVLAPTLTEIPDVSVRPV